MAPPEMADEQRAVALAKAHAARRVRVSVKRRLRDGSVTVEQVLAEAATDDVVGRMRVSEVIEALPGIGKVGVGQIMTELEIAPTRRLRGLGDRQRAALLAKFAAKSSD
ncbi:MAG: integration host factor [Mycobacterium sp.]|nr:integration host factor [Mycobacterium sp.]MDT5069784.1 hypothetical protein [Mycobacterium sp.]MDT5177229.1 hypothetical protein [Mycobacterium sp.]